LVEQVGAQVGQVLERRGLIERDIENAWLAGDFEAGPLDDLIGHSITYRIAVGPRAGQRLFTLQTMPPRLPGLELAPNGAVRAGGFSLHAGIDIQSAQREKLERLCRYISRPPVASSLSRNHGIARSSAGARDARLRHSPARHAPCRRDFSECTTGRDGADGSWLHRTGALPVALRATPRRTPWFAGPSQPGWLHLGPCPSPRSITPARDCRAPTREGRALQVLRTGREARCEPPQGPMDDSKEHSHDLHDSNRSVCGDTAGLRGPAVRTGLDRRG
jgi:hypothetical protein